MIKLNRIVIEIRKKKIESLTSERNNDELGWKKSLSDEEKTKLMVEAIFKELFSDYDFEKYISVRSEMQALDDDWDFGERYQELSAMLDSLKGNFYTTVLAEDFCEAIADKIADRIIEKLKKS